MSKYDHIKQKAHIKIVIGKYGLHHHSLLNRVKCYLMHIPFTRKLLPKYHDLECYGLIIVNLDGFMDGKEMEHEMRQRGFEL